MKIRSPKGIKAADTEVGLVYRTNSPGNQYVMKIDLLAGGGNRMVNLRTGQIVPNPSDYEYFEANAELVVS